MDLSQYQDMLNKINRKDNVLMGRKNEDDDTSSTSPIEIPENEELTFTVVNKTIKTPIALRDILVQGDALSRKIHFEMHRYFDGADLSEKDFFISYRNAYNNNGYDDNIENFTVTDDYITFDWWINGELTVFQGDVSIQIDICEYDESGDVFYRWQTVPCELEVERTVVSNGEAEPADYYLEVRFLNEYSDPIIYDEMSSTFAPIDIDEKNRTIIMPVLENVAVTKDSRSRLITFVMKRYIDNIDLSLKTPCIKYKLINGKGGYSFICNKKITETSLQFSWLLDSAVTSLVGKVEFALEFIGYNEKDEFYCWNTLPSHIFITEGLDIENIVEQPSATWIQNWNILADTYLQDYIKYINQVKNDVRQAMKSAEEAVLAAKGAKASAISADNDATIAFNQAERAKYYSEQAKSSELVSTDARDTTLEALIDFNKNVDSFRKKNELISKDELTVNLQNEINNKVSANDVRLKDTPITEADLDYELAFKVNNGGGGGGTPIAGAQIDDTDPSYSKVYSSKKTVDYVSSSIENAISGLNQTDNNFTNTEKQKLAGIERNANYYSHPLTHPSSIITTTPDRDFISEVERQLYEDKYTKAEIDNMIAQISSGIVWKPEVPTFADIERTYPNPEYNWCVACAEGTFLYDGDEWIKIGSGNVPLATRTNNGLMSSDDYFKLSQIEKGANKYVHPSTHSAEIIVETEKRKFITPELLNKIKDMDVYIDDLLDKYRLKTEKILESDLDQDFLDKVANAGGTIVNDNVTSTAQTYSSAKIENLIDDVVDMINDVPTNDVLDDFYITLGLP